MKQSAALETCYTTQLSAHIKVHRRHASANKMQIQIHVEWITEIKHLQFGIRYVLLTSIE